jgi:hypothetical protein
VSGPSPRAPTRPYPHAGRMAVPPVVIYPPDEDGGRRVRIDGSIVGRAFSVLDVARYLQEAGLQEADEMDVVRSLLIEWRGGGPEVWTH